LPPPLKSPTVFDSEEGSLDGKDWDRLFAKKVGRPQQ
jgi:hypothetical protein